MQTVKLTVEIFPGSTTQGTTVGTPSTTTTTQQTTPGMHVVMYRRCIDLISSICCW